MTLADYIRANPEATAEEILAARNAKTIERRRRERLTTAALILAFGADASRAVLGAMQAAAQVDPLVNAALGLLAGSGLDFGDDLTQAQIDGLQAATVLTADQATALKRLGVWEVSPHEQEHGEGTEATLEDVQTAMLDVSRDEAREKARQRYNETLTAINDGRDWAFVVGIWEAP